MFDLSFAEILVVAVVALFVVKPDDIPKIVKQIKKIKLYFLGLKEDISRQFSKEFADDKKTIDFLKRDVETMNYYLEKIIQIDGKYDGPYDIHHIKMYYTQLLKKASSEKESDREENSGDN